MLYLTVNSDNEEAKSLYKALGYQHASHQAQSAVFLNAQEHLPRNIVVVRLQPEVAAFLTSKHYEKEDLSLPTDEAFLRLVSSSDCEGTFLAIQKSEVPSNCAPLFAEGHEQELSTAVEEAVRSGILQNYGSVSLWNTSALKSFQVVRFVFLKETWLSLPFQATLLAGLVLPIGIWGSKLLGRIMSASKSYGLLGGDRSGAIETWSSWRTGFLVSETLAMLMISRYAVKTAKFFRFIVTRDSGHLSARAFAAFHHGPQGKDCMQGALVASRMYARTKCFGMWILNVADNHPDAKAFPKSGFRTQWLQKWLKDPPNQKSWPEFSPTAFCDPRNL